MKSGYKDTIAEALQFIGGALVLVVIGNQLDNSFHITARVNNYFSSSPIAEAKITPPDIIPAGPLPKVDAFDVLVDAKLYEGKTIIITQCFIYFAGMNSSSCGTFSPKGKPSEHLSINMDNADTGTRRELLARCAGFKDIDCVRDVTARVKVTPYRVELENAHIDWK